MVTPSNYFVFREAKNAKDLELLFKQRYKAFKESRFGLMVKENSLELDIDGYDFQSRHFGLFQVEDGQEKAVGYFRLVTDSAAPQMKDIWQLTIKYPELLHSLKYDSSIPLPSIANVDESDEVSQFYTAIKKDNLDMAEASRLTIDSSVRSVTISQFLTDALGAVSFYLMKLDHLLIGCRLGHYRFYKRLGFKLIKETNYNSVPSCILTTHLDIMPTDLKTRLKRMGNILQKHGTIHLYKEHPGCYTPVTALFEEKRTLQLAKSA